MKVICCYCKKVLKEGPEFPASHGCCPSCYDKQIALLKQMKQGEKKEDFLMGVLFIHFFHSVG